MQAAPRTWPPLFARGSRPRRIWRSLVLGTFLLFPARGEDALAPLRNHVAAHPRGRSLFAADLQHLRRGPQRDLPIGVFDSGIGGLTVLEAILKVDLVDNRTGKPGPDGIPDLAGERFIYLGDQANMPYGSYAAANGTDYLRELILKDVVFLLGRRYRPAPGAPPRFDKPPVKALVIACNTATAYGLEDIRAALKGWGLDIPVIGVVEAGAEAVAELLPASGAPPSVGVLATEGTCASGAYPAAIARAAERLGKTAPLVVQQGSVGLAGAIEGNPAFFASGVGSRPVAYQGPPWNPEVARAGGIEAGELLQGTLNSVKAYVRFDVASLALGLKARHPEAPALGLVVLGCTHFPLVEGEIQEAFRRVRTFTEGDGGSPFAQRILPDPLLVNPALHTAKALYKDLSDRQLRRRPRSRAAPAMGGFYFTVPNPGAPGVRLGGDGGLENGYRLGRKPGLLDLEDTCVVPLTARNLPQGSRQLVQSLPSVWKALAGSRR